MATSASYIGTSSCTANDGQIWSIWVDGTSATTAGYSNDVVWSSWTSAANHTVTYRDDSYYPDPTPETEEQRQDRLERQHQHRERIEAIRLEQEAAREKAEALLRESLDKEQREQFDKTEWFFVISQSGKRYRVRHGWAGNIDEISQDDMVVAKYCIHPQSRVPIEDSMLIQKLMLEADEERFIQIANKMPFGTPQPLAV